MKYNIYGEPNDEEYKQAKSNCTGEINIKKTNSNDKYYEYLLNSEYFDYRKNYKTYFVTYADNEKLDYGNIKNWNIEDKRNVRERIIKDIKDIVSEYRNNNETISYMPISNNDLFWWPIGSNETTYNNGITYATGDPASTVITSYFGLRILNGSNNNHGGIDLSGGTNISGIANVIASRSGTVIEVETGCISGGDMSCGRSYGNHVLIMHPDGLYTMYAHMHENSITVSEGDNVSQGQLIGKVGNSGHSYGAHLHFEVRLDANINSRTDPLQYIDPSNPRPQNNNAELVVMLTGFEGGSNVVICNPHDVPTVGHGITLTYKADYFAKYGYPLTTNNGYYNYCGQTFPTELLDAIYADLITDYKESIKMDIAGLGLTLTNNQIDALVSLKYNCGNIEGFKEAYSRYGSSESLCTNWWDSKAIRADGVVLKGLITRRKKECNLFVNGIYDGSYS